MNDDFSSDGAAQRRAHGQRRRGGRPVAASAGPRARSGNDGEGGSRRPPRREPAPASAEPENAKPARELLEEILTRMGLADVEIVYIARSEGEYFEVRGPDLANLIGRHGNTLEAVNLIFNNIINVGVRNNRKYYTIDAEGYRARRADQLKTLALATLERVVRESKPVKLEPMLPSERKIVHMALSDSPFVRTESEGVEPERRLVVFPKAD
ncbi:MAG: protein jag [Candidatus Velthaea sp.]